MTWAEGTWPWRYAVSSPSVWGKLYYGLIKAGVRFAIFSLMLHNSASPFVPLYTHVHGYGAKDWRKVLSSHLNLKHRKNSRRIAYRWAFMKMSIALRCKFDHVLLNGLAKEAECRGTAQSVIAHSRSSLNQLDCDDISKPSKGYDS